METKCRYCQLKIDTKQLAYHLKSRHNIIYKEYLDKYWDDIPGYGPCAICGTMIYIRNKKTCSEECYKKWQSYKSTGRIMPDRTKKHREKISEAAKKRLQNPENHPMFGKSHSKKSLEKISQKAKNRLKNPENHPMYGKLHSDGSILKIKNSAIERYKNGFEPPFKGKTHKPETIKKIFSHKKMTKPEEIVAKQLDKNKISYYFQFFIIQDKICKSYDFKIKNKDILIEVDGDYWHGGPAYKTHFKQVNKVKKNDILKEEIAKKNNYKIVRVWESELKENPQIIIERLNKIK